MLEWHVREEELPTPEVPGDEGPEEEPAARPRTWKRLALFLVLLLVLGGGILWWRLSTGEEQVQSDLQNFVWQEERARLAGSQEQAEDLVVPNVPAEWRTAYAATFQQPGGTIEHVEVIVEDFDGRCARVEVRLNGYPQRRRYCLVGETWRRAPLSTDDWGSQTRVRLPNRASLLYRERDAEFAERLAAELPAYFEAQAAWVVRRLPGGLNRSTVRRIEIAPHDGFGPLVSDTDDTIVLNSPLLVPYDGVLSPEARVRLALARTLLTRAGPPPRSARDVPGGERFWEAAHLIAAAHVALTDEEIERLIAYHRRQLGGKWVSPFFADWLTPDQAHLADWAAYLLAEWVYRQVGLEGLATLVHRLPSLREWDSVFWETLGRTTREVELAAAAMAGADTSAIPPPTTGSETAPVSVRATVLAVGGRRRLLVRLPDTPTPVIIETSDLTVRYSESSRLDLQLSCLGPGTELAVWGRWLENGYRLKAEFISLRRLEPPDFLPAEGQTPGEAEEALAALLTPVPPETAAYVYVDQEEGRFSLQAITAGGETRVFPLPPGSLGLLPLPGKRHEELRFGIFYTSRECNWRWFTVYHPQRGTLEKWRGAPHAAFVFWMPEAEEFLAVWTFYPNVPVAGVLMPHGEALEFVLPAGYRHVPLGWRGDTRELLLDTLSGSNEQRTVRLLALKVPDGTTRWLMPGEAIPFKYSIAVDPTGRYVAFVSAENELLLWDLRTNTTRQAFLLDPQEGAENLMWAPFTDPPTLLVGVGPRVPSTGSSYTVQVNRLVLVTPDATEPTVVPVTADEQEGVFFYGVLCSDGAVLYSTISNRDPNSFHLYRHRPGEERVELLSSDRLMVPLACP